METQTPTKTGRTGTWLNAREVCDMLGSKAINPSTTLYRLVKTRGFPRGSRLGGSRMLWLVSDIEAWMHNTHAMNK